MRAIADIMSESCNLPGRRLSKRYGFAITRKALALEPDDRFASATAMADALDGAVSGAAVAAGAAGVAAAGAAGAGAGAAGAGAGGSSGMGLAGAAAVGAMAMSGTA